MLIRSDNLAKAVILASFGVLLYITQAFAVGSSGTENAVLSTRSLSRSNAVVADPQEASTIAFNPAGLTEIKQNELYLGSGLILADFNYGGAEGRSDESNSQSVIPVPYAYYSMATPIENLYVGVGSNAPFGLVTKYSSAGNFQFISHYNEIAAAGYHVSGAYRLSNKLSLGAGWTYAEVDLKQVGKFNSAMITGDLTPATFEYDTDGQGQSWNVGLLLKLNDTDTVGLFYRSELRTHLKGEISTHELTGTMAALFGGPSHRSSVDTDLTFPSNITLGYKKQINKKTDLEFDLGWTGWSSLDNQRNVFGNSNAVLNGFTKINRDWKDTWSLHLGGTHVLSDQWSLSAGYSFFERAVTKANYSNEIPDGHRHNLSTGIEYAINSWVVDLNYTYIVLSRVEIENTTGAGNFTDIDGEYYGRAHVVSSGLRRSF